MEKPYKGRATIQDNLTEFQITIPAKRNWFVIIFLGAWLCGWCMGEFFAISAVSGLLGGNFAGVFILFWLAGWTIAGFFVIKAFLWIIKGKEIITVGQNVLKIDKKGALFFKPKVYDLKEVNNMRVQDDNPAFNTLFVGGRRNDLGTFGMRGVIRFDYGLKTVKFANDIDEAEARFILSKLKEQHLLTEKNLG